MRLQQVYSAMLGVAALAASYSSTALDYIPNQVLVKFHEKASVEAVAGVYSAQRLWDVRLYNLLGVEKWDVAPSQGVEQTVANLRKNPAVEFAEPNYVRKAYAQRSDWVNQAAYGLIDIASGWDAVVTGAATSSQLHSPQSVIVAVFDTAVDVNHPDLIPYLWRSGAKKGYDGVDNDYDPSPGKCVDPFTGDVSTDPPHGTMVTSVIAGMLDLIKSQTGTVAPIQILPVRLGCWFTQEAELRAIEFALANKVNIINASYGSVWYSGIARNALTKLRDKDILFVAAAGNFDGNNDKMPNYPSDYDLPNIISVGATEGADPDKLTTWSHYGATSVDLAAPGSIVTVTDTFGVYKPEAGTSFASPLVAGVAAMVMSATPPKNVAGATVRKVRAALQAGVTALRDRGFLATDGRVNLSGAVEYLKKPAPMIVVRSIKIDDTKGGGNGNHELDPGETVSLIVELENFGEIAFNTNVSLSFATSGFAGFTLSASPVSVGSIPSGGTARATFNLSADADRWSFTRLPLQIDISSASTLYNVTRRAPLEYGPLTARKSVQGTIYTAYGNAQDDTQIYHVTVSPEFNFVKFSLSCGPNCKNPQGKLSLVGRWGALPRFGWEEDYNGNYVLVRDDNDVAGISAGNNVNVSVPGGAGNYYVAVTVNQDYSTLGSGAAPLDYTLIAEPGYNPPAAKPRNFGCTMGSGTGGFDPVFFLLLLGAIWRIGGRRLTDR